MGIILSRYGHGLAIRHDLAPYEGSAWMREIARWADIPLINLQCDIDHPTQTLADLMTLREQRGGDLRGLRVAVSWAYAPSYAKPRNSASTAVPTRPAAPLPARARQPGPARDLTPRPSQCDGRRRRQQRGRWRCKRSGGRRRPPEFHDR